MLGRAVRRILAATASSEQGLPIQTHIPPRQRREVAAGPPRDRSAVRPSASASSDAVLILLVRAPSLFVVYSSLPLLDVLGVENVLDRGAR